LKKKAMHYFILLVFLNLSFFGFAQATFEKTRHNFGEIEELREGVDFSFKFLNDGSDTIKVKSVKASCGCTIPKWSREPIAPGDSGEIVAHYNSYNRPGAFNKSLKIYWSEGPSQVLYIQGSVLPRTKSPSEQFPVLIGSLRTKHKTFNMGNFTTENVYSKSFAIYNDSRDTIYLKPKEHQLPDYLTFEVRSDTLLPERKTRVTLLVDPTKVGELGFIQHELKLATTDEKIPVKAYQVYSTIEEYFAPMTDEEKAKAPRLTFSEGTLDFGQMSVGTAIQKTITLTNTGLSPLNIRQVKSNCGCVQSRLKKSDIKPGKSVELIVTFDAAGRKGRQYKTLTVFSNDPSRPTQTVSIKAYVK
jgi:uncharacterized cupredoxin-like copper-binding protein